MPPDATVTDKIKKAFGGPSAVEQGVGVHGKEEGDDLVVGEAVQPGLVVAIERTNVDLWKGKLVQVLKQGYKMLIKNVPLKNSWSV